jgi:translation initiation factor 1
MGAVVRSRPLLQQHAGRFVADGADYFASPLLTSCFIVLTTDAFDEDDKQKGVLDKKDSGKAGAHNDEAGVIEDKVHVRVQQRNGRKCITTIEGLATDLDIKRICKAFKKNFSCNGAVQKDEDVGEVIQLSGDQRTNVKDFLVDQEICLAESIVLHGF